MKKLMTMLCLLGGGIVHAEDMSGVLSPAPMPVSPPVSNAPAMQGNRLTFIDSRIFDVELFHLLENNKDTVEVTMAGHVPLTSIPPRLDRWIAKAAEGGTVEILPQPSTRIFAFSLISMAFSSLGAWEKFREESAYEQAKKYDIKIYYKRDGDGDALIEKLVLTRRKK